MHFNPNFLKGLQYIGVISGTTIGVNQGYTRNLDRSSYGYMHPWG